jgi:hypothetical protein
LSEHFLCKVAKIPATLNQTLLLPPKKTRLLNRSICKAFMAQFMRAFPVFEVVFTLLAYYPKTGEIVDGIITEIELDFAYVKVGCDDAMLYSTDMHGYLESDGEVEFDTKRAVIRTTVSKKICRVGSRIRGRIIRKGWLGDNTAQGRVSRIVISCKEPTLGVLPECWQQECLLVPDLSLSPNAGANGLVKEIHDNIWVRI